MEDLLCTLAGRHKCMNRETGGKRKKERKEGG
jgi:hypothetical protein